MQLFGHGDKASEMANELLSDVYSSLEPIARDTSLLKGIADMVMHRVN